MPRQGEVGARCSVWIKRSKPVAGSGLRSGWDRFDLPIAKIELSLEKVLLLFPERSTIFAIVTEEAKAPLS